MCIRDRGGTVQNPDGEIVSCDIDIHLAGDKWDHVSFLVNLLNRLGIPNGSALLGICLLYTSRCV